jgi:hypothetical protein
MLILSFLTSMLPLFVEVFYYLSRRSRIELASENLDNVSVDSISNGLAAE